MSKFYIASLIAAISFVPASAIAADLNVAPQASTTSQLFGGTSGTAINIALDDRSFQNRDGRRGNVRSNRSNRGQIRNNRASRNQAGNNRSNRGQITDNRASRSESRADRINRGERVQNNSGVRNDRRDFRNDRRDFRNDRGFRNDRRDFRNDRQARSNQYFYNGKFHNRWNNRWRNDRRYNFRSHRSRFSNNFRIGFYSSPFRSHRYTRFGIGGYLASAFFHNRYWISDPYYYRLPAAYGAYRWVRYYNDIFLVDTRSGFIADVEYGFFL